MNFIQVNKINTLMKVKDLSFSNYTLNELLVALEDVDISQHPENALNIYKLILERKHLNYREVTAEVLGYKNESSLRSWLLTLIPFITTFEMDNEELNNHMHEKIIILNSMLKKSD